jgi:hypothetical protein
LLRSAALSITAVASASAQTFPFVTVSNFPEIVSEITNLNSIHTVGWAPTVEGMNTSLVEAWNEYAVMNQGWIEEYRSAQNPELSEDGTIQESMRMGSTPVISSVVVPVWQMSPVNAATTDLVNSDLLSNTRGHVSRAILEGIERHIDTVTLTSANSVFEWLCPRCSLIISPIVSVQSNTKLVVGGIMWALLSWDDLMVEKLPDATGSHLVEIHNDCGLELSYEVKGASSVFAGEGSLHNNDFDDLAMRLSNFGSNAATVCPFSVAAYPTTDFEDEYVSNAAWIYSACVIGVFFAAAAVFACYDCIVQSRQAKLLTAAQQTSAIVAEIFPKNVQKRIIEEKEQRAMHNSRSSMHNSRSNILGPKSELKNLIGQEETNLNYKGKPIADLFPETTIMFADVRFERFGRRCIVARESVLLMFLFQIVGFTAWSSTREPTQVFTLLEGIYAAFDAIAAKRRVFKVETIGTTLSIDSVKRLVRDVLLNALLFACRRRLLCRRRWFARPEKRSCDCHGEIRERLLIPIQKLNKRNGGRIGSRHNGVGHPYWYSLWTYCGWGAPGRAKPLPAFW